MSRFKKVAGRGATNTRPAGQTFLERCSMSSISNAAFTFNGDQTLIGNTRFQSGCADELSAAASEFDDEVPLHPDPEIDRLFEAEMIRRDAFASSAGIEHRVGCAAGGKFTASVRDGTRVHSLGKFKSERDAWTACQQKAAELRNTARGTR